MPFTNAFKQTLLAGIFTGARLGLGRGETTEVTHDGNYERISAGNMFTATNSKVYNNTAFRFNECELAGGYGSVTHLLVYGSTGTQTFFIPLVPSLNVSMDYMVKFAVSNVTVELSDNNS